MFIFARNHVLASILLQAAVVIEVVLLVKVGIVAVIVHLWYNCRALAVTAIAVHRTIATAIDSRLDYG